MSRRRNPYARADARTRAAKASGYPARSVFKLREIDRRCRLLGPGQHVLDLGAAPGSWARYAAERVGARGRVVAVDQRPLETAAGETVISVIADALGEPTAEVLANAPYDVVLSDLAPKTTGTKFADGVRSFELFMAALGLARRLGRPGSGFVGKIFMAEDFPRAKQAVGAAFDQARVIKPSGTRPSSSEIYLVGLRLRHDAEGGRIRSE